METDPSALHLDGLIDYKTGKIYFTGPEEKNVFELTKAFAEQIGQSAVLVTITKR